MKRDMQIMQIAPPAGAAPVIGGAWACKDESGVEVFADKDLRQRLQFWPYYRSDCPSLRQRFLHHEGRCYALHWKRF